MSRDPEDTFPVFMRRPKPGPVPVEGLPEHYISANDLPDIEGISEGVQLLTRQTKFNRDGDPLAAIEAFLLSNKAGIYPPLWVLDFMTGVFEHWRQRNGSESLDKLFGLSRGKGQQPALKEALRQERDQNIMLDMWRLRGLFSATLEEAAHMIARRMEDEDWDGTGLNLGDLTADTILDKYRKDGWAQLFSKYPDSYLPKWNQDKRDKYLALFPADSYPPGMK